MAGIIAEIISACDESSNEDTTSMMHGTDGLVVKVKGRERFEILKFRREITGCLIARVRILPDIILANNPLSQNYLKNASYYMKSYLNKNQTHNLNEQNQIICSQSRASISSLHLPHPSWVYRKYDCDYIIHLIVKELLETFKQKLPFNINHSEKSQENLLDIRDALCFSNWLLKNFPFTDKMRLDCLKLNCVNHRLSHMYNLLKSFTNISCQNCEVKLCSKYDVFSISKQGKLEILLSNLHVFFLLEYFDEIIK